MYAFSYRPIERYGMIEEKVGLSINIFFLKIFFFLLSAGFFFIYSTAYSK